MVTRGTNWPVLAAVLLLAFLAGLGVWFGLADDEPGAGPTPPASSGTASVTSSVTPSATPSASPSGTPTSTTTPSPPTRTDDTVQPGVWTARGLTLTVSEDGATAEFDCATGEITEPLLLTRGQATWQGSYLSGVGGPGGSGAPSPTPHDAQWRARLTSDGRLQVAVHLTTGATHGPYALELGAPVRLERCM